MTSAPEDATAESGAKPADGGETLNYRTGERPQLDAVRGLAESLLERCPGLAVEVALGVAVLLDQGRAEEALVRLRDAREQLAARMEILREQQRRARGAA